MIKNIIITVLILALLILSLVLGAVYWRAYNNELRNIDAWLDEQTPAVLKTTTSRANRLSIQKGVPNPNAKVKNDNFSNFYVPVSNEYFLSDKDLKEIKTILTNPFSFSDVRKNYENKRKLAIWLNSNKYSPDITHKDFPLLSGVPTHSLNFYKDDDLLIQTVFLMDLEAFIPERTRFKPIYLHKNLDYEASTKLKSFFKKYDTKLTVDTSLIPDVKPIKKSPPIDVEFK